MYLERWRWFDGVMVRWQFIVIVPCIAASHCRSTASSSSIHRTVSKPIHQPRPRWSEGALRDPIRIMKKNFWHVLMNFIFWWNMLFNQGFALVRIRLADAISYDLSNTQITSNDGRFCFKARTINIHLVFRYEGFKSMPNDYELLCLYTFEDRVKESSFVFRGLSSNSRIVHSYGDVTIRAANFVLYMLVTHGHWAVRVRDTHTYCWAFSSGAVTTCFYDLVLSWLNFEHPTFRMRGERSNPLRHRRGV